MFPLTYTPQYNFMNITDSFGMFICLNDTLSSNNATHNLTFNTIPNTNITLAQNYTMRWIYVCIFFGGTTQIVINSTTIFPFTLASTTHSSPSFNFNLNISTFREVRLYNHTRTTAELIASSHRQADPLKEDLQFYYALLCNQSQSYLYNSMNPSISQSTFLSDISWQANYLGEFLLCPVGYYNTITPGNENKSQEAATCTSI